MCIAPKAPPMPPPPPAPEPPPPPPPPPPTPVSPAATGQSPTVVRPGESARASSQRSARRGPGMLRIPSGTVPVSVSATSPSGGGSSGGAINLNIGK